MPNLSYVELFWLLNFPSKREREREREKERERERERGGGGGHDGTFYKVKDGHHNQPRYLAVL